MTTATRITLLLLLSCALLLAAACLSPRPQDGDGAAAPPDHTTAPLKFLRSVGDVVVRVDGTAALKKYAPEVMPIVDTNPPDGTVTLEEVETLVREVQDPDQLTWLLLMARGIYEARRGGT